LAFEGEAKNNKKTRRIEERRKYNRKIIFAHFPCRMDADGHKVALA
jgi:hypothetical protein